MQKRKRTNPIVKVCLMVLVLAGVVLPGAADDKAQSGPQLMELRSVAPNVFFDCSRRSCDMDYIRTEITFVNYVRDRENADVHILITLERTGSGGNEYIMDFIGLGKYKGRDTVLKYISLATDTPDQIRRGMVNVLKQGLIPYVSDTPLAEFISITYNGQPGRSRPAEVKDKWNLWVFSTGLRGNLNLETLSKRYSYSLSLSANRTTEEMKFRFWVNGNFIERRYDVDGDIIISKSDRKTIYSQLVKSLGDHWSYGASLRLYSSTYDNARMFTSLGPAVEYNIFPYEQANRRELRIQYRLSYSFRRYNELTIFDKMREGLFSQSLQAVMEVKEPWGSMGFSLQGSHFFHDFSKNNVKLDAGLSFRVFKGFFFNVSGSYSRVRDQLALPAGGATTEEVLLELKRLATNYSARLEMGVSYRFGSMYSNVVNPRFGN
jgi:hypothetical protein